jgi:hypothetical protein
MPRISRRDVYPSGISSRNLSNFIFGTEVGTATASSVANGSGFSVTATITQNGEYELQAHPYWAVYVGSVTGANQLFPDVGESQDITDWQITGPAFDWHDWQANSYPRHKEYSTLRIQNVSAGTVDVLIRTKWRYISPREGS